MNIKNPTSDRDDLSVGSEDQPRDSYFDALTCSQGFGEDKVMIILCVNLANCCSTYRKKNSRGLSGFTLQFERHGVPRPDVIAHVAQ